MTNRDKLRQALYAEMANSLNFAISGIARGFNDLAKILGDCIEEERPISQETKKAYERRISDVLPATKRFITDYTHEDVYRFTRGDPITFYGLKDAHQIDIFHRHINRGISCIDLAIGKDIRSVTGVTDTLNNVEKCLRAAVTALKTENPDVNEQLKKQTKFFSIVAYGFVCQNEPLNFNRETLEMLKAEREERAEREAEREAFNQEMDKRQREVERIISEDEPVLEELKKQHPDWFDRSNLPPEKQKELQRLEARKMQSQKILDEMKELARKFDARYAESKKLHADLASREEDLQSRE